MDHASDCLSSVAHVPQHGKDETFLVTYVSHSDSIELVNLGFLSFFHPSCPSLPKRVQFSSCWQRLSDADLCHKGTCTHACMHACSSIQCHHARSLFSNDPNIFRLDETHQSCTFQWPNDREMPMPMPMLTPIRRTVQSGCVEFCLDPCLPGLWNR